MSTRQTPPAAVSPVPGRSPSPGSTRRWRPAGYTGLVGYELFPARSTREAVKAILDAG